MKNFVLLAAIVAFVILGAVQADKITSLPNYNGPELSMYSGYINIDKTTNSNMFYWLVEAENDPANKPLVFWFQGGPGCSGLIGLLSEMGPIQPTPDGNVAYRDLGWTQLVNMVFMESPIGVGFSYASDTSAYTTNDNITAANNLKFVQGFLEEFPQYKGRDTWFTGESYGGIYVPTLTELVLRNSSTSLYQQFKGIMVGNPVFRCTDVNYLAIQFNLFYWHGLVSYSHYSNWTANNCDEKVTLVCDEIFVVAQKEIGVIDQQLVSSSSSSPPPVPIQPSIDPDDLYQDFCTGNGTLEATATIPLNCHSVSANVNAYLNTPAVQSAIHAKPASWSSCSNSINYTTLDYSMIPLYQDFFKQKPGFHVLVYSGDVDIATCPFAQTQPCLHKLKVTEKKLWQPWFVNGATAGYVEQFEEYTYATVKGAGHEVPHYQPLSAFQMFKRFLQKQDLLTEGPAFAPRKRTVTEGMRLRNFLSSPRS